MIQSVIECANRQGTRTNWELVKWGPGPAALSCSIIIPCCEVFVTAGTQIVTVNKLVVRICSQFEIRFVERSIKFHVNQNTPLWYLSLLPLPTSQFTLTLSLWFMLDMSEVRLYIVEYVYCTELPHTNIKMHTKYIHIEMESDSAEWLWGMTQCPRFL